MESLRSVNEAGERLGVKETTVKKLIRDGDLLSVRIGDRRLIPDSAIDAYIGRLVAEARGELVGAA
jgi:excisionase family DNA binding protein